MNDVPFDHHDHVGERRQIRAAGDARPHHRGDLRDAQIPPHDRVVVEDAARAVLPGKHAALVRQVHARRIDEIDDRDAAAHRDLLRAQNLRDRLGPPRAGLHRRVVGDDDDLAPVHDADAGDDAGAGRLAVVLVVRDEQADLEEARAGIAAAAAMRSRAVSFPCLCCSLDLVRRRRPRGAASSSARTSALSSRSAARAALTLPAARARRTTP